MKTNTVSHGEQPLKLMFRSFHYHNYRLFFSGQAVSVIGTWIQNIAMSWLVYRLTGSPLILGLVGFASQIPTFLFTPFAGVLADRWNRHRILVATQSLALLQAFILSFLVLTGRVEVWHVFVLATFLGFVNAMDIPVRQSFVVEMVEDKNDLGNAIALNSSMFNGARLVGPSIAGILIYLVGEGFCFLINGISYLAVIMALLAMKVKPREINVSHSHVLEGLKEGFVYAAGFAPIRYILLLVAAISLVGMPYSVLMPVFAGDVLHGGPQTLGFLIGFSGMGALAGAAYLASRKSVRGLEKNIPFAAGLFGVCLVFFSLSRELWLSLLLMLVSGFGMMVFMASCNTVVQTVVDDDKRGRIMSLYTMAFMGMVPIGSLFAGALANRIGAPGTVLIGGIASFIFSLIFAGKVKMLMEIVRPVYEEKLEMRQ